MKGFFAYSNHPRIADTLTDFAKELTDGGLIHLETWQDMNIGGKLLVSEICKKIEACDVFFADKTAMSINTS